VSLAIWDHTVLPSTRHKSTYPDLNPERQAGTRFTYPGGMEGWVDLSDRLHTEMVYPHTDGHPSIQQCTDGSRTQTPVDHKSDALTPTVTPGIAWCCRPVNLLSPSAAAPLQVRPTSPRVRSISPRLQHESRVTETVTSRQLQQQQQQQTSM